MTAKSTRPPPDCEAVVRAIWAYLDGRLDAEQVAEIEAHLAWCHGCVAHTEFERRLVRELAAVSREHSDPETLRTRIHEALRNAR